MLPPGEQLIHLRSTSEAPAYVNPGAGGLTRELFIGSRVHVKRHAQLGVIRWLGIFKGKGLAGVEMEQPQDTYCDGAFCGVKLFHCPAKQGLFVAWSSCNPFEQPLAKITSNTVNTTVSNAGQTNAAARQDEPMEEDEWVFVDKVQQPGKPAWQCAACTFMNNGDRPGCEMCAAGRPQLDQGAMNGLMQEDRHAENVQPPTPQAAAAIEQWMCPKCYSYNPPTSRICVSSKCGAPDAAGAGPQVTVAPTQPGIAAGPTLGAASNGIADIAGNQRAPTVNQYQNFGEVHPTRPGAVQYLSPQVQEELRRNLPNNIQAQLPPVPTPTVTPPQQNGWQCPHCTLVNELERPVCGMCATKRPAVDAHHTEAALPQQPVPAFPAPAAAAAPAFPAPAPTFPAPAQAPAPQQATPGGRWTCADCTLSNNAIRRTCEMCNAPRRDIPQNPPAQVGGQAQAASHNVYTQPGPAQAGGQAQAVSHNVYTQPGPSQQHTAPQQLDASGRWTCADCTLSNNAIRRTCEMCNAPRRDLPQNPPAQAGGQAQAASHDVYTQPGPAQVGGQAQAVSHNVYTQPGPAQQHTAPQQHDASGRWTCAGCTLSNNALRRTCEMCSAPRRDLPQNPPAQVGGQAQAASHNVYTQPGPAQVGGQAQAVSHNVYTQPGPAQQHTAPQQHDASGRWTCADCTLSNNAIRRTCEMCNAERKDLPQNPPAQAGGQAQAASHNVYTQPGLAQAGGQAQAASHNVYTQPGPALQHAAPQPFNGNPRPAAAVGPSLDENAVGWVCPQCTFRNQPTRPGCAGCAGNRPADYQVPANYQLGADERLRQLQEKTNLVLYHKEVQENRQRNYVDLVKAEDENVVHPDEQFECGICMGDVDPEEGVRLHDCLHVFCRECLAGHIEHTEDIPIRCPFRADYECTQIISDREIKQIVSDEIYERYQHHGFIKGAQLLENRIQCMTPNCIGVYERDEAVRQFTCLVCQNINCLDCEVIHNMTCQAYQEEQRRIQEEQEANEVRQRTDQEEHASKAKLRDMRAGKVTMNCPYCHVNIEKNGGCPNMTCGNCGRGFRWEPAGR